MKIIHVGRQVGMFPTLQEAIDRIAEDHREPVRVVLEPGVYREKVVVNKDFVEIVGYGAEVVWDDYALQLLPDGTTKNTFLTATMLVTGADVTLRGLTVRNDAGDGRKVGQAVALYAAGDRFACFECRFVAAQDTLYTGPVLWKLHHHTSRVIPLGVENVADRPDTDARQYYHRCFIQGDVDFIFGPYRCWFEECTLYANARGGYYTAANTQMDQPYGLVFHRCRLTGECEKGEMYLGRPWREGAATAFLECEMGECVHPAGFCDWESPFRAVTRRLCEYGTYGVDTSARNQAAGWLTPEEAKEYTMEKVLNGWKPPEETSR